MRHNKYMGAPYMGTPQREHSTIVVPACGTPAGAISPARMEQTACAGAVTAPSAISEVQARAHAERKMIAEEAGVGLLAEDAAASIDAANSVEEMLSALLAMAYNASMRLATTASTVGRADVMVRLSNASAKMMQAFADGTVALHKLRSGGKQTIVVQHVEQALIAGEVKGGKRGV